MQGALHNDTAYGVVEPPDTHGRSQVVHRVPLGSLKPKQLDSIRDPLICEILKVKTAGLEGKSFTENLIEAGEAMSPPVRKVRILKTLRVIPTVLDKDGNVQKAYKGDANYCYDIYPNEKGKWTGHVVSRFTANQKEFKQRARNLPDGTPLIMRIRGNDMISVGEGEERRIFRVVKFSTGRIALAEHFESGALKARDADKEDNFKYLITSPLTLQKLNARLVHVSPAGSLYDPGYVK